jgi:hypothetical protein
VRCAGKIARQVPSCRAVKCRRNRPSRAVVVEPVHFQVFDPAALKYTRIVLPA